jgi:hypothetical protein
VSTAFDKTRKLPLEPLDIGAWIKLAIITFFVGTGTTSFNPGNNPQYAFNRGDIGDPPSHDIGHALSDSTLIRRGFKVFVFNAIVAILVVGAIIVAMILAILSVLGGGDFWSASTWDNISTASLFALVIVIIIGLLAIIAFTVILGLFVGFFYDFGVPLMYFRQMGLRQSIGHVGGMVRRQPLEFFVYVIVHWVLELVIAIVTGIIVLFFMAIFIAIGIITLIAMLKAAETSLLLALPFALALIIGFLLLLIVSAFIAMPVQVYLRYYSLDFLKSFDPSYMNYTGRIAETGA